MMKTCIAACIVCLCSCCYPNECSRDVFRSSLEFMDISVRNNDLWSVIPQYEDMGACAKKCAFFSSCQSFTYNRITKYCRGHSEIFDVQSRDFIPDPGAQYYYSNAQIPTTPMTTTTKKSSGKGRGQAITSLAPNVTEAEQFPSSTFQVPESTTTPQVPESTTTPQVPESTTTPQVPESTTTPQVPESTTMSTTKSDVPESTSASTTTL
ncbi:mucin-2-like [Ostrea edulis]|uniref:mucin-2-like n=1 Tax=Ostrea edulis TaxID=37623 RepID=UPI0024AF3B99|nr:mucin-2-like [Ostrea edulis]